MPDIESVTEALQFAEHLALDSESHYRAARLGSTDFIGWGQQEDLQADTYDALVVILSSLGGKTPSEDDLHKRPERAAEVDAPATIADFDVARFQRRLAGA